MPDNNHPYPFWLKSIWAMATQAVETRSVGVQTDPFVDHLAIVALDSDKVDSTSWSQRLLEAERLGILTSAYHLGIRPGLPSPKRWSGYKTRCWAVAAPQESAGTYATWAAAKPLVQDERGNWLPGAAWVGFASEKESKRFLSTFAAASNAIWPPVVTP